MPEESKQVAATTVTPQSLLQIIDEWVRTGSRGDPRDLDAHLAATSERVLDSTRTTVRCHFLRLDAHGRPRLEPLVRYLVTLVVDYAIPRSQIEAAHKATTSRGSTKAIVELHTKAISLFTDLKKTGEGGELLLYALLEHLLGVPQILCKMSLKTNASMHIHGVDGVHAAVDKKSGNLCIYWGESKLYQSIGSGVKECFESLAKFLHSDGSTVSPAERDISLVRDQADLNDPDAQLAIKAFLNPDSILNNKVEYRGACLVGFDFDKYPSATQAMTVEELKKTVEEAAVEWRNHIREKLTDPHKLTAFSIEVFLVPFPSVEEFRKAFLKALKVS